MPNLNRSARIKPERETSGAERAVIDSYLTRSVPEKHRLATQRALLGQVPRSVAIRVHCLQCCNYSRDDVAECGVLTCALHPVRPYQDRVAQTTADDEEPGSGDAEE